MTVFVDTGLFYALQGAGTPRHEPARRALSRVIDGRYGALVTSDYVVDEAATLVRSRSGSYEQARTVIDRALGRGGYPAIFDLHHVDPPLFDRAIDVFERYSDHALSFTDSTTIAVVEAEGIDHVLAFDDDFDGIVDRLDPTAL